MKSTYIKNLLFIVALLFVFAGGYVGYRYHDAATLTSDYRLDYKSFNPGKHEAAVCSGSQGGFEGTAVGSSYIYKGMERTNYIYFESNAQHGVHYLIDHEGIRHQWNDGSNLGGRASADSDVWRAGDAMFSSIECLPWWRPDESMFKIPDDVTFEDIAGS